MCTQAQIILNPSSCVGNDFPNPNLSFGTPTTGDQDIDRAAAFSRIWATGSFAEFYPGNYAPSVFSPPSPVTGNYVSCWISTKVRPNASFREGFQVRLNAPIAANSGAYTLSFDMACLGGWGTTVLAVYALHNPSGSTAPNPPTGAFTPNNLTLFGSSNTKLIGTITISSCSNNKTRQTITFSSAGSFPSGGATHLFITRADNTLNQGERYMSFDNFCLPIRKCPVVSNESLICTGFDHNFDGILDYEYTFSVTPNAGNTRLSSTCGSFNRSLVPFTQGGNNNTYRVTFFPNNNNCSLIIEHRLSSTTTSNCLRHSSNALTVPCPRRGGGGGFGRLQVTPNPANSQIQVQWETTELPEQINLDVFNSSGIRVQSLERVNSYDGQIRMNVADLPKGVYYIKIQGEHYTPAPIKFIKQ